MGGAYLAPGDWNWLRGLLARIVASECWAGDSGLGDSVIPPIPRIEEFVLLVLLIGEVARLFRVLGLLVADMGVVLLWPGVGGNRLPGEGPVDVADLAGVIGG